MAPSEHSEPSQPSQPSQPPPPSQPSQPSQPSEPPQPYHPTTLAIHADARLNTHPDIAPPIHLSTTYRYPSSPSDLHPTPSPTTAAALLTPSTPPVYSRLATPTTNRLETLLAPLLYPSAPPSAHQDLATHVLTYASGLAAVHALLVRLAPRVLALSGGYHGVHALAALHGRLHGLRCVELVAPPPTTAAATTTATTTTTTAAGEEGEAEAEAEGEREREAATAAATAAAWDAAGLGHGDVVLIETPTNPTGEARRIAPFAALAQQRGAWCVVDATFGPPGLQEPWRWGAHVVVHSGTKYLGGHSDALWGVLATREGKVGRALAAALRAERLLLGGVVGGLEGWLGVRSLRTLALRVERQSGSAGRLVGWLSACLGGEAEGEEKVVVGEAEMQVVAALVERVQHASLQREDMGWLKQQMPNGFGPVFAIWMRDPAAARALPSKLKLFQHATSLGGVESLIEWRRMSDFDVDERLLRISVGIEDWRDLKADLLAGMKALLEEGVQGVQEIQGGEAEVPLR